MAPSVLARVTGTPASHLTPQPAILHDHRRHRVKGADYPGLLPCRGTSTRGTLVSGLGEADIWRLDVFEGSDYARRFVSVRVDGAEEDVSAETYVWIGKEESLEDEEWDFDVFVKERMWAWAGTDEGFGDVERAVEERERTGERDLTGGRGVNGDFEKRVEQGSWGDDKKVGEVSWGDETRVEKGASWHV